MGNVTTLLFDLGGVLIELGPLEELMAASSQNPAHIWAAWSRSPSVRRYESGQCSDKTFAASMINEFDMEISPDEFLELFLAWPRGSIPGAADILSGLGRNFTLACLSNTNEAHYENLIRHEPLMTHFEEQFLSYQTGLLKPDAAAFLHALDALAAKPEEILFFDDNPLNVDMANSLGIRAIQVNSLDDVINGLNGVDTAP